MMKTPADEHAIRSFLLFSALAFLITWGTGMLLVLSTRASMVNGAHPIEHPIPLPVPLAITLTMIGGFGPFLAAIAVTASQSGRAGVRELLRQFRGWRVHPGWYTTAFLGPAFLGLVSLCFAAASGGATPSHWFSFPRPLLFAGWSVGPWGEELGWRGFAQPVLQKRIGALGASLSVGIVWSLWHYWPLATPAGGSLTELVQAPFATWLLYELANSVMMAWLYNSAGESLPIAWAAHVGLSLGQNLVNAHPIPIGWFVAVFLIAASIVVVVNGPKTLCRSGLDKPT